MKDTHRDVLFLMDPKALEAARNHHVSTRGTSLNIGVGERPREPGADPGLLDQTSSEVSPHPRLLNYVSQHELYFFFFLGNQRILSATPLNLRNEHSKDIIIFNSIRRYLDIWILPSH